MVDLVTVTSAIAKMGAKVAWEKAKRKESVIKLLLHFKLDPNKSPTNFDDIYVYTLIVYGVDRPEPVLNFFRNEFIKEAFRQSFYQKDPSILVVEAESIIQWNEESSRLGQIDYDPRREFEAFSMVFNAIVDHARTPVEVKSDQKLETIHSDLHQATDEIVKRLDSLPALSDVRAEDTRLVRATFLGYLAQQESITALYQIQKTLDHNYSSEQFVQDIQTYVIHVERSFHNLSISGIVFKDKITDPELNSIFVPISVALEDQTVPEEKRQGSIIALLKRNPYLVILGGPGSGKSTITRYLAWSHSLANLPNSTVPNIPLLSNNPLPLRIELRHFVEDRRQHPNYDFLTYTTEVLLRREGVEINPQMFKNLLEQKKMLLLFDGLDEVATLDERRHLIEQIEHFTQRYVGNHVVVTSRPVGYDIARFSDQQFTHAKVKEFSDEQIWEYLERWYKHVLRLSPIPYSDQQELEKLFTALKDNPRLHKLAVNPLLLTVIIALHRYERLPDRRVMVYDRCADLLLETWAKLKGTDAQWKDMKMGKEDQSACVADLGFVLHERSQQNESNSRKGVDSTSTEGISIDVTARFIKQEIVRFLKKGKLIKEVVEQRAEAERFLELIKKESGLIVERGKDESGEDLYGFVHLTFQEYFAAADVYERYQQEEDKTIISKFLKERLHDPHWHEVILLLLGKLKSRPVTNQLRQILEGKIKSRRSQFTDVVQQDLFFISDCLAEEIAVESELAEKVSSSLSNVVKTSPFPSQRVKAINHLGSLAQTKQYASLALKELVALVIQDNIQNIDTKITGAKILYRNSPNGSEEKRQAIRVISNLGQHPNLSIEHQIQVAQALYQCSPSSSEEPAAQMLLDLIKKHNLSVEQQIQITEILTWFYFSPEEERQAIQMLSQLAQHSNLTFEQQVQVAEALYQSTPSFSEKEQQAIQMLSQLAQRSNLTVEQQVQVAEALNNFYSSEEFKRQAIQMLSQLAQRSNLTVEQQVQVAEIVSNLYPSSSEERQQASKILFQLVQHSNSSVQLQTKVAEVLYQSSPPSSEEEQQAIQILSQLAQRSNLTVEQQVQVVKAISQCKITSPEKKQANQMILSIAQHPNLSTIQKAKTVDIFFSYTFLSKGKRAIQMIMPPLQLLNLSIEQKVQVAKDPFRYRFSSLKERRQMTLMLLQLAQRSDISVEIQVQVLEIFHQYSSYYSRDEKRQQVVQKLLQLAQQPDFTTEQIVQVAEVIYQYSTSSEKEPQQQITQKLWELAQRPDLAIEQQVQVASALYKSSGPTSPEERQAVKTLFTLAQNQNLTLEQRLQAVGILLDTKKENYSDRIQAVQMILTLLKREAIEDFLKKHWQTMGSKKVDSNSIEALFKLAINNVLPVNVRDEMYELLLQMVPQFGDASNI